MLTNSQRLDRTFAALADPTRRAIIGRLARGPASVGELARPFPVSRPPNSPHLPLLGRCPPVRLVFPWDWEEPASRVGDTVVTVEFKDAGGDRTEVVLTHERFTDPARMGRHQEGSTDLLNLLQRHVGGIRP